MTHRAPKWTVNLSLGSNYFLGGGYEMLYPLYFRPEGLEYHTKTAWDDIYAVHNQVNSANGRNDYTPQGKLTNTDKKKENLAELAKELSKDHPIKGVSYHVLTARASRSYELQIKCKVEQKTFRWIPGRESIPKGLKDLLS